MDGLPAPDDQPPHPPSEPLPFRRPVAAIDDRLDRYQERRETFDAAAESPDLQAE